jgi:hypothetical protein
MNKIAGISIALLVVAVVAAFGDAKPTTKQQLTKNTTATAQPNDALGFAGGPWCPPHCNH